MPMINTFGVIGGDERMKYLAQSIAADGYPVCVCGLEKLGTCRGGMRPAAARGEKLRHPFAAARNKGRSVFKRAVCRKRNSFR